MMTTSGSWPWWTVVVALYVLSTILVLRVRNRGSSSAAAELEPIEVGALESKAHATVVAVSELVLAEAVEIDGRLVRRRSASGTASLHPFTRGILRSTPRSTAIDVERLENSSNQEWSQLVLGLAERGYLARPPGLARLLAMIMVAAVGVAFGPFGVPLFGAPASTAARWVFGLIAGWLLVNAIALLRVILRGRRRGLPMLRRTSEANTQIEELRKKYEHLAPQRRPAVRLYGPRESAMAVALFGSEAVPSVDAAFRSDPAEGRGAMAPLRRRLGALGLVGLVFVRGSDGASCSGAVGFWADGDSGGSGCGGGGGGCGGGD